MISNVRFKAIDDLKNLRAEIPKSLDKEDNKQTSKLAEENKIIKIGMIRQSTEERKNK